MATADSLSISNYGYGNLYNDPAWQKYWAMSQQMDSLAAVQNSNALAQAANTATQTTTATNPTFTGAAAPATEEKGSNNLLAGALALGATTISAAWWIASRGKSAGAKGLMNQLKAGLKSFGKKGADVATSPAIRTVNGKTVVNIPKTPRGMNVGTSYKNSTELADKAKALGLDVNTGLKLTDGAAKLKSTHFEFSIKSGKGKPATKYEGVYRDEKIVSLVDDKGNKIALDSLDKNLQAEITKIEESLTKTKSATGVTLSNTLYGQTLDDGVALFLTNAGTKDGLRVVRTSRYHLTDDGVMAARGVDKKLNEGLKEVESGKFDSWNVTEGTWKPSLSKSVWEKLGLKKSAEYKGVIDGKAWDDNIEFVIKNNGVAGIVKDGKTYNQHSKIFQDLKANYPALFDDVMNHQKDFTGNIVRTLA